MSETKARFTHVQTAIVTLRRGKQDPHWLEAAEYLIEHAAFDTKLLLEAQIALERAKVDSQRQDSIPATRTKRYLYLATACCVIALLEAFLLWILWRNACV